MLHVRMLHQSFQMESNSAMGTTWALHACEHHSHPAFIGPYVLMEGTRQGTGNTAG